MLFKCYSKFSQAGKVLESPARFPAQEGEAKIIPSRLLILSQMEKSKYTGGTQITPSRFLFRPGTLTNSA